MGSLVFGFTNRNKENSTAVEKGKVIALLNQKGGVGKTTMAYNLAFALATTGKKVLCIDFDPQANLTHLFGGLEENKDSVSIFQMLINSIKELKKLHTAAFLSDAILEKGPVDLIASSQELSGFDLTVAGINRPRQMILKNFIDKNGLTDIYDYIVIDGPPTLGLLVVNILCAANGVLIPFQADQFSRVGLEHFHQTLEDIDDMGLVPSPKIIGYIPNLVDQRRKQTKEDFSAIKNDLGMSNITARIFDPFFNRASLSKAGSLGKSVFEFKNKDFMELQKQFENMAIHIQETLE